MKSLLAKILATTLTGLILITIVASSVAAEEPPENYDYPDCCQENIGRNRHQYHRRYNFNQVETINGEVVSIETYTTSRSGGVHLLVDTGKETVEVHLGPSWYLQQQDFAIAPEDKITVTGSRINFNGESAIIAQQIERGSQTLILRDNNGFPIWSRRNY